MKTVIQKIYIKEKQSLVQYWDYNTNFKDLFKSIISFIWLNSTNDLKLTPRTPTATHVQKILNLESRESIESLNSCSITIEEGGPHQENCTICYKKLCSKCFQKLELFPSKRTQTFQCSHCEEIKELKNTILCYIVNTLQLLIFLSLSPLVAFALALNKTEKLIQEIETKIESIFIILIVNLLFSIPIYVGELIYCILIAPFKILLAFHEAIDRRDFVIMKRVFSQQ